MSAHRRPDAPGHHKDESTSTGEKHVKAIFGTLQLADTPVHRRVTAVLTFLREPQG